MCQSWARFCRAAYLRSRTRRRSGVTEGWKKRDGRGSLSPLWKRRPGLLYLARGDRGARSVRPRSLSGTRPEDKSSPRERPLLFLLLLLLPIPEGRNWTEKLPFRRTVRGKVVFRGSMNFPPSSQSVVTRDFDCCEHCEFLRNNFEWVVSEQVNTFKRTRLPVRINNVINNLNAKCTIRSFYIFYFLFSL